MPHFNGFDYAVFALLFFSVIIGMIRGFAKEIIALIAWVAAFAVATLYSVKVAALFVSAPVNTSPQDPVDYLPMAAIIISYLALFIGTLICGSILKYIVSHVVEGTGLGFFNRFFGAILGFVKGGVIALLVMFFLSYTALVKQTLWQNATTIQVFSPAIKWLNVQVKPYVEKIEAKIKKTAQGLQEEPMPDVIKPHVPQPQE